tara:strand:+ start:606 stop:944 length:339 start_codon:yes stop_codon:yes gene_type:complete
MEWKSSTYKKKYGNVIGEVKHHTLFEDGSITNYDVQFGNRLVKSIPADKLVVVKEQSHSHEPDEKEVEEGGPGSGRPTKPGSKRDMEKRMDKAVSDANAKLDAAEKAMKKKK